MIYQHVAAIEIENNLKFSISKGYANHCMFKPNSFSIHY